MNDTYNHGMDGTGNISVVNVMLQETGTYNDMFSRPMNIHMDGEQFDRISGRMEQVGYGPVYHNLFSDIATEIIRPSAAIDENAVLNIPHGFGQRRFQFSIVFQVRTRTGSEMYYIVQGYTEHNDIRSLISNTLDPETLFVINSYMCIRRRTRLVRDPVSGVEYPTEEDIIVESAQVIDGRFHVQNAETGVAYTMRPSDMFAGIEQQWMTNGAGSFGVDNLNDTRTVINHNSTKMKRSHSLPDVYLADFVDTYRTGRMNGQFSVNDHQVPARCRQMLNDSPLLENPVIRELSRIRGMHGTTSFTWRDLMTLDPRSDDVCDVVTMGDARACNLPEAGSTEYWNGSSMEQEMANILKSTIPGLASSCSLSMVEFNANNKGPNGMPMVYFVSDPKSALHTDLTPFINQFVDRLTKDVLYGMSMQNEIVYDFYMYYEWAGTCHISISVDGGPRVDYTVPAFCDSLDSQNITVSHNVFTDNVYSMDRLLSGLNESINRISTDSFRPGV